MALQYSAANEVDFISDIMDSVFCAVNPLYAQNGVRFRRRGFHFNGI